MHYYSQAIRGQYQIITKKAPIHSILNDTNTPDSLHKQLKLVLDIRKFATQTLKLPDNKSYLTYADLERRYAVWNVFAAPIYSLEPKEWCYPIAGCVSYRGYFSEKQAIAYATILKKKNYDVYVAGISAYSTLGWFADPVLNTFVYRDQASLAGLIFHELAHQLIYIPGDTVFNESFATTVEQEGVRQWLTATGNRQVFKDYIVKYTRHQQFVQMVIDHKNNLEDVYASQLSLPQKKAAKTRAFTHLKADYFRLKQSWNGYSGYDNWFSNDLNNAKLITVATYHDLVPGFQRLLLKEENDFNAFYASCRKLADTPQHERHALLK